MDNACLVGLIDADVYTASGVSQLPEQLLDHLIITTYLLKELSQTCQFTQIYSNWVSLTCAEDLLCLLKNGYPWEQPIK